MNAAVIFETRIITDEVLNRHLSYLPDGWELIAFTTIDNIKTVRKYGGRVILTPRINSINDYNNYMVNPKIWDLLSYYERVLIFQSDSGLIRKGIEEFLEWDYVGAPWLPTAPWARKDRKGGNGGLSLRNPKLCLSLIRRIPYNPSIGYEDCYFTHHLDKIGGKIAPYEVCQRFSVETEYYSQPLGYHAIDKHLTPQQVNLIINGL